MSGLSFESCQRQARPTSRRGARPGRPRGTPAPHPLFAPAGASGRHATLTGALPASVHDRRRYPREAAARQGHASPAIPSGDEAAILDRALTALLSDLARRKFAATDRPRPSPRTATGSRHIPAEVKRAVWLRDLGRCAFVGTSGQRCRERAFLEFHHVQPYEVGGEATVANVQLRCRCHNVHEARVYFGPARAYVGGGFVGETRPTRSRTGRNVTRGETLCAAP